MSEIIIKDTEKAQKVFCNGKEFVVDDLCIYKKRNTDKEIDEIVEKYFFYSKDVSGILHLGLCRVFSNTRYEKRWNKYWDMINTDNHPRIHVDVEPPYEYYHQILATLRLVIVQEFKYWVRTGRFF
jgi:hypothetical protein